MKSPGVCAPEWVPGTLPTFFFLFCGPYSVRMVERATKLDVLTRAEVGTLKDKPGAKPAIAPP